MINSHTEHLLSYLDQTATSGHTAIFGDGGWAFLHGDTNSFLYYYFGIQGWNRRMRRTTIEIIQKRSETIQNLGAKYMKFIVPEKIAVYHALAPEPLRSSAESRHRPARSLALFASENVRYPLDSLRSLSASEHLYFRGDSHPNWAGAYVIYRQIIDALREDGTGRICKPRPFSELKADLVEADGDLVRKVPPQLWPADAGLLSPAKAYQHAIRYRIATPNSMDVPSPYQQYANRPAIVREQPGSELPRAVVFHDSTATLMYELLSEHFSRCVFIWKRGGVYQDVIEREQPDYVIHIMAERFVSSPKKLFERLLPRLVSPRQTYEYTGLLPTGDDMSAASCGGASYALNRLRRNRETLSRIRDGFGGQMVYAAIGDSWTASTRHHTKLLTRRLRAAPSLGGFGDAGFGWVSFCGSGIDEEHANAHVSGSWKPSTFPAPSPDMGMVESAMPGDRITLTFDVPQDSAVLHGRSGRVRYRSLVSGIPDTWIEIAFATDVFQAVTLKLASDLTAIEIEVVSGLVKLHGIDLRRSTSGVRWHKLGKAGTHTGEWASIDEAAFIAGIAALEPDYVHIFHGTNDQEFAGWPNQTPEQSAENIGTIIDRCRLAAPATDIMIITSPETRISGDYPAMTEFAAAHRMIASEKGVAHLDLQTAFGSHLNQYAFESTGALLDHSLNHPNKSGRHVIAEALWQILANIDS